MKLRTSSCFVILTLALFWGAGVAMGEPIQPGSAYSSSGISPIGYHNAIIWRLITVDSDEVPVKLIGGVYKGDISQEFEAGESTLVKIAIYDAADLTTPLDTTEELATFATTSTWRQAIFLNQYTITSAGDYAVALWGKDDAVAENGRLLYQNDCCDDDTAWVMVSQTYGNAWPTLSRSNAQARDNYALSVIGLPSYDTVGLDDNIEDVWITELQFGSGDVINYGVSSYFNIETSVGFSNTDTGSALIRLTDVANLVGADMQIDACTLWVYAYAAAASGDLSAYSVFKPWDEGSGNGTAADTTDGACFRYWDLASGSGDQGWGTDGCYNADDGGSDNSSDGSGVDRKATAENTQTVSAAGWVGLDLTTLAGTWYDGTKNEEGVVLQMSDQDDIAVRSSETTVPYWPIFQLLTSSTVAAETPSRRRRVLIGGQ